MDTQDVRTLFAFNGWANRRILGTASRLTPAEFTRDLGASFGSIRGTLVHIMWGERRWLRFWLDGSIIPDSTLDDFPDVATLAESWSSLERDVKAFAGELNEERLQRHLAVRGEDFTLGELVQHLLNHSTYHRGQIALLLRQLGHTPPATDYRLFLSENRAPRPPVT